MTQQAAPRLGTAAEPFRYRLPVLRKQHKISFHFRNLHQDHSVAGHKDILIVTMKDTRPGFPGVAHPHDFVENKLRNREETMATIMAPVIAGYAFDRAPDLTDAGVREQLSPTALKAFSRIIDKWKLTETQARGLLGGIASSTYHTWRTEPKKQKLSQDTLIRISLVIGIYKALNIYFGEPWADRWITLENRGIMFGGLAPVDYMIQRGQPGMSQVRRLLDSWRGGK